MILNELLALTMDGTDNTTDGVHIVKTMQVSVVNSPSPTLTVMNNVTPANGFTGSVNVTCSVSTAIINVTDMPACSLNPTAISINGAAAGTSTLTVSTTARTSGALAPAIRPFRFGGVAVLAALLMFGLPCRRRAWMRMFAVLVLIAGLGLAACGGGGGGSGSGGTGGGGNPGTTPGSYSVKVTATDAATGKITAQTTVAVTVN